MATVIGNYTAVSFYGGFPFWGGIWVSNMSHLTTKFSESASTLWATLSTCALQVPSQRGRLDGNPAQVLFTKWTTLLGLPWRVPLTGWPTPQECGYLTVLEGKDLRSKCQQVWFLLRPLTLASKQLSLPLSLCMVVCVGVCVYTIKKMCVCMCVYPNENVCVRECVYIA